MNTFEEAKKIKWILKEIDIGYKTKVAYFEDQDIDPELKDLMRENFIGNGRFTILIAKISNKKVSCYLCIDEKEVDVDFYKIENNEDEDGPFITKTIKLEELRYHLLSIRSFFMYFDKIGSELSEKELRMKLQIE